MAASPFPDGIPVASFFVARTPLLPFDALPRSIEGRFGGLLALPEVQEALLMASPELVDRVELVERNEANGRVELAVARYLLRMCGRPTPFGLFAGVTLGEVGQVTTIDLAPRADYARHARLDNDYVFTLAERLEHAPELAATLRLTPNSSLYEAGGSFRYAETRRDGKAQTHHLVAVLASDYLKATLERARSGATTGQLAAALVEIDSDIGLDEATSFIELLVESGILVSDLAPAVTGSEPFDDLLNRLESHAPAAPTRARLRECKSAIDALARAPLGIPRECFASVSRRFEGLPSEVDLSRFLQVDLVKPAKAAVLGPEPIAEILRGVELLWRLSPPAQNSVLARFATAFRDRYEGREIPLVEALDDDLGLEFAVKGRSRGAAAPLLDRLSFPEGKDEPVTWTRKHEFLHRRLFAALAAGDDEIALTASDIEALEGKDVSPLPAAFAVMATLGATSSEAVARGDFQVLVHSVSGPSGANLLGRFCHADPRLYERVVEHLRAEELHEPHAVFAELVHLPEGRLANVIARPVLRAYEIPYLGRSSAAIERQLPITDLTLALDGSRLILRSRRLRREIIPRLTSAHNAPLSSLPIYRFLAALQHQGCARLLRWDWGPFRSSKFLPRVVSGRVLLSPAWWRLSKNDADRFRAESGDRRVRALEEWRSGCRVPRFVILTDGNHGLPLDLDSPLGVDVLVDSAGRAGGALLHEMNPGPDALFASGPEGRFVHELIVPFVQPVRKTARPPRTRSRSELTRSFQPGTEWLYAKLYSSESNADRVLREVVDPLRRMALARGLADRWFFLRYADPETHLRVRFHGVPAGLTASLVPALRDATEPLLRERTLWRVQLDTYEREVERYGGDEGMLVCERIFHEDSETVFELLAGLTGDSGAEVRWKLALVGIDRWLALFDFDVAAKRSIVSNLRGGIGREARAGKELHVQLGNKFRENRRELERIVAGHTNGDDTMSAGLALLARRSELMAPIVEELTSLASAGRLTVEPSFVAASLVHMFVNRLLRSQHRRQELVLYDFLDRIYESRVARHGTVSRLRRPTELLVETEGHAP
jgi:thiopeptide-type bacteriocin biosynthesis protein